MALYWYIVCDLLAKVQLNDQNKAMDICCLTFQQKRFANYCLRYYPWYQTSRISALEDSYWFLSLHMFNEEAPLHVYFPIQHIQKESRHRHNS